MEIDELRDFYLKLLSEPWRLTDREIAFLRECLEGLE